MNLAEIQKKLIETARANPPDERVPYAFEKRIMACLTNQMPQDPWAVWGRAFTRAAALCVVVMLMLAGGSFFLQPAPSNSESLSQDVEQTLFAAVDNSNVGDQQQDVR
jgi:hypothetical protein